MFKTPDESRIQLGYELHSYGIKLTKEQVELIKYKEMKFYNMNGQTLFPIVKETGEYAFYIIWE